MTKQFVALPPTELGQEILGSTVKSFFETAQLADGRPTDIVEETKRVDIYAHWKRFVAGDEIGFTGGKIPVQDSELLGLGEDRPCPIFARRLRSPLTLPARFRRFSAILSAAMDLFRKLR